MATICFYQDTRHEKSLYWIKNILNIGYISRRNDGMTELRINGYSQTKNILKAMKPFVKFKKLQCTALIRACKVLSETKYKNLVKKQLLDIVDCILVIQNENYVAKNKKTKEDLLTILGLTP